MKDESDSPFVGVALKHKPAYILSYNKRHYKIKELGRQGVFVITPKEALDLIGVEKLELKTTEKRRRNMLSYFSKFKVLIKR